MGRRDSPVIIACSNLSIIDESQRERERESTAMADPQPKRAKFTGASSSTISKSRGRKQGTESPPLPSSDSQEKINVPSESGANSGPSASYASYTSVTGNNYYVFLSFRGPDTRKGFVDHLYHKLVDVGLHHPNFVFRDDEDLSFGENIGENLFSAIERSKVSIPVISENYAASEWCLRELIKIMECKESRGQIVLPVLYKVEPKDVKYLQGSFGDAFRRCEHRFDEEVKQKGKEALKEAVASRVFESEKFANGYEGKLIKELVEIIRRKQRHDFSPPPPGDLVGIDDRVADVMKLMDITCPDTQIIGICGMGGIGKTTLARIIYEKLSDKFECRSFLKDIRETTKSKGIEHVQSLLISDITKSRDCRVRDSEEGIGMIRSNCKEKKVLILLDDVDRQDHLDKGHIDNLIGGCNFRSGSRIIITCRDKALLKFGYIRYELEKMNRKDSLLLFSRYAFEGEQPPTELTSLSHDIVATTGGLPLALVVIGSLLKEFKDQTMWRETLGKLSKRPHMTIQQKLRISYDSLEKEEQRIFLDIACIFIGTDKRIAIYLWEDLQLSPNSGLQVLINRSLIKIDDKNKLRMHDQLRDLGRVIARPEGTKPWECSRLWDKEAMTVLSRKEQNESIKALRLDEGGSREFMEQESFKKMPNLKFLHVNDVDFDGDFEGSLSELRWLKCERCPGSFKATNVHLEKLVILDLSRDNFLEKDISQNWRKWSLIKMERLKVLDLSGWSRLKSTPNLSAFKNLEMLILKYCENLKEIHPSIGDVKCLVSLNLTRCWSLEKLPEQLGELKKLEELVVDETSIQEIPQCIGSLEKLKTLSATRCLQLTEVPSSIGKLGELVELDLSSTMIKELPESLGELNKLKILDIGYSEIERLPSSIGKLQSLQKFDASCCHNLTGEIHVDEGGLSSLKTLLLESTGIPGLPENLDQLSSLEHLDLRGCGQLQSLPKPPLSLSSLELTCRSKELPSLSHLNHLKELFLAGCESLQSIPELSHLNHLKELTLGSCNSLRSIPELSHLNHLKELFLYSCESLQSIPELPSCIQKLLVRECPKLERLPKLSDFEFLSELELVECRGLKKLDGLEALKSLRTLDLTHCSQLESLPKPPFSLSSLGLTCGSNELPSLSHLNHLEELTLRSCESLQSIPELPSCIQKLHVRECPKLERLPKLSDLEFLSELELVECRGLKKLEGLEALKSLRKLDLSTTAWFCWVSASTWFSFFDNLHEIGGLEKLGSLEVLDISGRKHIQVLDLSKSEHLKRLIVQDCPRLVEIRCHSKFLEYFNRDGCKSLKKLPDFLPREFRRNF